MTYLIQEGGILAYPLIACSIIGLTIILERSFFWLVKKQGNALRGLVILETIVTVTPVLGILGTILGIMDIFQAQSIDSQEGFQLFSAGISKALITTAVGLTISIICLVFYNLFASLGEKYEKKASH